MASDPFPPHPANNLETSTAMVPVTTDDLDHAAKQAAAMVENIAQNRQAATSRPRRGGRKPADSPRSATDAAAASETAVAIEPATDRILEGVVQQAGATAQPSIGEQPVPLVQRAYIDGADQSASSAVETLARFNAKAAEAMRTNLDALSSFCMSMMGAGWLSEALALQAQHARRQMEALTAQSRELSSLAQKLAADTLGQFKAGSHRPT